MKRESCVPRGCRVDSQEEVKEVRMYLVGAMLSSNLMQLAFRRFTTNCLKKKRSDQNGIKQERWLLRCKRERERFESWPKVVDGALLNGRWREGCLARKVTVLSDSLAFFPCLIKQWLPDQTSTESPNTLNHRFHRFPFHPSQVFKFRCQQSSTSSSFLLLNKTFKLPHSHPSFLIRMAGNKMDVDDLADDLMNDESIPPTGVQSPGEKARARQAFLDFVFKDREPVGPKSEEDDQKKGKERESSTLTTSKPIFDHKSPVALYDSGPATCFKQGGYLMAGQVRENPLHHTFIKGVGIYRLEGRGANQYVAWLLNDQESPKKIAAFFSELLGNEDSEFIQRNIYELMMGDVNDIFVEKTAGLPYGRYMSMICNDKDRRRAASLLIAALGRRNKTPCDCCMFRMGRYSSQGVPVMVPFFECRSIQGFKRNACANCVYAIEGQECCFNKLADFAVIDNAIASRQTDFRNMPPSELQISSATQIVSQYDYDECREASIGEIKGIKVQPRRPKLEERREWE